MKLKETLLNEGPGAGYEVSGFISHVKVNSFTIDKVEDEEYNATFEISCNATAIFEDVEFHSYYYGGKLDATPIQINDFVLFMDNLPGYNDAEDITNENIEKSLENLYIKVMIGGGYLHTTFDGHIETTEVNENSVYLGEILGISFDMLRDKDIVYIDRKVSGDLEDEEEEYY